MRKENYVYAYIHTHSHISTCVGKFFLFIFLSWQARMLMMDSAVNFTLSGCLSLAELFKVLG